MAVLYGKLESLNPTGSFKDRGSAVVMSGLLDAGQEMTVIDSSGNAGASLAAYGARAGIRVRVYVPAEAPPAKIAAIIAYDAEVVRVRGGRDRVAAAAQGYAEKKGACYCSGNYHPLALEGMKTFGFELVEAFGSNLPEHVVIPAGNGVLLSGTWLALRAAHHIGRIRRLPKIHCVQAQACKPLAVAFQKGLMHVPDFPVRPTIADGLVLRNPPRGLQTLTAVRSTGGQIVAVGDRATLRWQGHLAARDAVLCEPSSAAAMAGVELLVERGVIGCGERVILAITGNGLKTIHAMQSRA